MVGSERFNREPTTMLIQPYLMFEGRAEEAIRFYEIALGAKVEMIMRYSESPEPIPAGMLPPGAEDKIMHASLDVGGAKVLLTDGRCQSAPTFHGVSLSLSVPDDATARRMFEALAEGGQVRMPMGKTFWASLFGVVADRFGVSWMVMSMPAA